MRTEPGWIDAQGIQSRGRDCLASMGIYLFNRRTLVRLLEQSDYQDFGKEVFPMSIRTHRVQVHLFDGYWEDIGTIRSFYEANIALASPTPPFDFIAEDAPIYTRPRYLPPVRIEGANITNSLIADGCVIEKGAVIENSVIGLRCRIGRDVTIRNSVLMGADFYHEPDGNGDAAPVDKPPLGIGAGSRIEGAIIDKNCSIGRKVYIVPTSGNMPDADLGPVVIRDGIIVVQRAATIPDGWSLAAR